MSRPRRAGAACEYVPETIPFAGVQFDVVYAFSVFTHLPERVADAVQKAVRDRIEPGGLFAITIRPVAYWDVQTQLAEGYDKKSLKASHRDSGFAFAPHGGFGDTMFEGNSEAIYGDASMTLDYIQANWPRWKLAGSDRSRFDQYQDYVYLQPC